MNVFLLVSKEDINLGFPHNVSFGVGGSIYVVGFYGLLKTLEQEFGKEDEFEVNEVPSSTTINDSSGFDDLVANGKSNRNTQDPFIG